MICIVKCADCKYIRDNIDGWLPACDAFPEGVPDDFNYGDIKEGVPCNHQNGIGFNPVYDGDSNGQR